MPMHPPQVALSIVRETRCLWHLHC